MASSAANLATILQKTSIIDDEQALKAAIRALELSKNDIGALHTQIVALIKLDRFKEAFCALKDGGDKISEQFLIEKAYTLYKTGHLPDAENLLRKTNKRGLKHVAAQVAYRAERFTDAESYYKELCSKTPLIEGEEVDLKVNVSAIEAQLEWQGKNDQIVKNEVKPLGEDMKLFEISYNAACKCIAQQDLNHASILLKRARDLCEAMDELSDEEKKTEILPIIVQQAYVLTRLGKHEEAGTLQSLISIDDILEPPTKAIAHNNFLASNKCENPYTSQKFFDSIANLTRSEKPFWYQANVLQRNKLIIDIEAQKYSGVIKSTTKLISESSPTISPHINLLSVINAAAHAKKQVGKNSLKVILPLLEKRPKDVGLVLTAVQLCALDNNFGQAIFRLENLFKHLEDSEVPEDQDIRFAPGLVALLVSLYRLSGRKTPIRSILLRAVSHWRSRSRTVIPILRATGMSLLDSKMPEDLPAASEIFNSIREKNPDDRIATAGYIASNASVDLEKVSSDLDKLTPVPHLISGIDVISLENSGIPSLTTPLTKPKKKRGGDEDKKPKKKRKLSTKRMPKIFETSKTMDPERWLSARDRSNYQPHGKKWKKKPLDSTQGGIVKDQENSGTMNLVGSIKSDKTVTVKAKKKKGRK
ncbi:Signal recognition particle subunit SRP72 [Golovinomyces cichoracearum]|uniref:Signal recognition particle subunit SRP72 n=1 Tax=Golovinomyces cichoracearum TaxID=62708 RepID=A0A420IN48_9PEZI|nr:Signal recognition particle subunit SRP72 [Golovinomyces cichoracearum]